jgi:RimJ/RimL family protein N-acetyltransferase
MEFRSVNEQDLDRVTAVTVEEPVSWIPAERYLEELAEGMYRPEWTWIAEDGDRLVARALWWGPADSTHPYALDCLYVDGSVTDRAAVATGLLQAGHRWLLDQGAESAPLFNITLANGWRSDPAIRDAMAWREAAATAAGLSHAVERLRFEWTPEDPVPEATGRLLFRPEPDDEVVLDVFRRIAEGSLDDETRKNLARMGVEDTARHELDYYLDCPGDRDWWRLAHTPDGALVGLAVPSANAYNRNVGYLGVVPEQRGKGYVDDILGEITRIHAAAGAELITATTDMGNAPMAAAFQRAGYHNTQTRMFFSAP